MHRFATKGYNVAAPRFRMVSPPQEVWNAVAHYYKPVRRITAEALRSNVRDEILSEARGVLVCVLMNDAGLDADQVAAFLGLTAGAVRRIYQRTERRLLLWDMETWQAVKSVRRLLAELGGKRG